MITDKQLVLDVISFVTKKHPNVLFAILLRENIGLLKSDYTAVIVDITQFLVKEHPDVILEFIDSFAPRIIEEFLNKKQAEIKSGS